jgi:hypothetical protein
VSALTLSPMNALETLTALHHGEGAAVAFARSAPDGWQECGAILTTDLPAKWPSIEVHLTRDSYFGLSSTYAQPRATGITAVGLPLWSRRSERLRWLNAVAVDLDHHADQNFSVESLLDAVWRELARQQIPSPTFLSFSGRGLWVLWQIADHANQSQPVRAFPDKRDLMQRINQALVKKLALMGADRSVTDPARVMRLPDSVNSKAAPENSRVRFFRASASVYTLPELAAVLGVYARKVSLPGERTTKDQAKTNAAAMRWRYPLDGFRALWRMRGGFTEGTRRPAIYIYSMLLRKNRATPKEVLAECLRLAESLKPTLNDANVRRSIAASDKAITYNFSNAKLAAMLKITAEEQAALPQWFRPKTRKDKSSRIAERRDVILRELQAGGPISTRRLVALLLEKHGLRVSQSTVMNDVRFLSTEQFPVLMGSTPSVYKQQKLFTPGNSSENTPLEATKAASARVDKGAARLSTRDRSHHPTRLSRKNCSPCWVQSGGTA